MKDRQRINQCLKNIDRSYKLIPNNVRIHNSNDLKHELAKTKVCYLLQQQGLEYYTETTFVGKKGRADILVPSKFLIIEILNSETESEVLSKYEYYPEGMDISYYTVDEVMSNEFII
ncbi:MAG: hypothetical protein ACOCRK_10565 [bacterium]